MLRSVSARIAAVTLVAAGGVIVIFTLFFVAERNLRSANNATTRAADVSSVGLTLRASVTQLDSAFRAALRERNGTTLADWHRAAAAWHQPGERLAVIVQRPGDVQHVHEIETLINQYVDDYGNPVLGIAQFSPSTAKSADVSEEGRLRIAQITKRIDSITGAAARSAALRSRHADGFANRVTEAGLAALIITPLLLLFGGVWLMRAVARPLGAVVSAASSVAAGDFEVHLDEDDRRDEFGALARAFNRMTSALKTNREELVTRAQRLEESERRKSELISIVSHEVRTPLASILGFARLLLERDLTQDEQRAYLRIIDDEATRLASLVSDFLDIRLLEDRRFPLRAIELDIRPIVVDQAERMLARHPEHTLETAVGAEPVLVVGDEQRLTQVVINLLSNAEKFSPSDGRIRVGVSRTAAGVRVFVEDEGPGIPPEHADEVFEPFVRGDAAAAGIAGAGIGLALCRRIIEAHGGRIGFENLRPGARFWFELPAEGLVPEDDRLPDAAHV